MEVENVVNQEVGSFMGYTSYLGITSYLKLGAQEAEGFALMVISYSDKNSEGAINLHHHGFGRDNQLVCNKAPGRRSMVRS